MNVLGRHLLVELHGCDAAALDDGELVRDSMLEAARMVCATVIGVTEHRFSPHGVTVVVVIAESHLSIHTWPEYAYAAIDVFTCGEGLDSDAVTSYLSGQFRARHTSAIEVKRGAFVDWSTSMST